MDGPRHFLRNPDIRRLALCKVGANRQRIFLLKDGEGEETAVAAMARLVKEPGNDWKTAYVPVAVPLSDEDPGMFGEKGSVDVWEPEQIAKAAHGFMAHGAEIVAKHFDSDLAPGVKLVENAVALADFKVGDTLIKEGTWYVGLEFDGRARELVDAGEIDAVSVEGFADRIVAKAETFSKPGTADVTPEDRAKIKPLAMHYLGKPHPFTTCVRDQESHGLSPDHAKRRCAVLLDTFDPARLRHSVAKEDEPTEADWNATVDELVADQPDEEIGWFRRLAKSLGFERGGLREDGGTVEDMEIGERVEALEKQVGEVASNLSKLTAEDGVLAKLAAGQDEIAKKLPEPEPTEPTADELKAALAKAEESIGEVLAPLAKRIEALESGDSTQTTEPRTPVAKSEENGKGSAAGIFFD